MQIALKTQAETYFQSITNLQEAHNCLVGVKQLQKFYTLLIYRYLPNNQLIPKIRIFHQTNKLKWQAFINAVWGLFLVVTENSPNINLLVGLVTSIDSLNIVDRNLLIKSLPQNLIQLAGIEKKQTLKKKLERARRKFYFDQKKNNLMRQNNQGFARLSLLLATLGQAHPHDVVWDKIISLIGNFDLDPDRVLDLIIESYLQSTNSQIYLAIIKKFNPQSIVALVGNRILKECPTEISQKLVYAGKVQNFITSSQEQLYRQLPNTPNPKLIFLLCMYVKQKFIKIQSVIPYLTPNDSIFEKQQIKRLNYGKQKISKSFKLVMEEKTQLQLAKIKQQENLKIYGQLLHSSKLALINGFVQINDWSNFNNIWNQHKQKMDLILYQPLLRSLLNMLQWVIDPLYKKICFSKYFKYNYNLKISFPQYANKQNQKSQQRKQMTQCIQLNQQEFNKIIQLFELVQIYVGFKSNLYVKICRLFSAILKQPHIFNKQEMNSQSVIEIQLPISIKQNIERIIRIYLVPGISLQTGNPALTKQLYEMLQNFNYRFRYKCYLHHYHEGMVMNPLLAHIFYKTRNKQTIIVNNLSDKNKKVFMKKMAKLTHNQALQTFYWIFRRILMEDYEKVVPQIVGVLANCCPLTLQMSIFIALHILNVQKQPAMNFKTGEQTAWFKNLINYISLFYRKYLQIDIQPVFDYIIMKIGQDVSQLEQNQQLPGALLGLLHQILSKMFCNFVLKEVNKNKLETLCAGPYLQLQAMDISSQIKASKKSKVILQKFFWGKSVDQYDGQSLAISLLILLTQKRAQLIHKSYISNLKIIGDIYDDYTVLIIQLIRVLNQLSTGYERFAKLLPPNSLNLFINQYKLPVQIAFQIFRPSVKLISTMSAQQWNQFVKYVGQVISQYFANQNKYLHGYNENQEVKKYLSENYSKITHILSHQFFTTFWMLTLDSIYFPAKLYTQKLQQVKKKAQKSTKGVGKPEKNDRQVQKARTLLINLKNQESQQSKKFQQTMSENNLSRLKVQYLKNASKDDKDKNASNQIIQFAQIFSQVCLIPRMMLDPQEAFYCMKITVEVIKINKLTSSKSIKLLIFIIQHVMNYLPYATQRQASYCLAIFLSEILNVLSNWNDLTKLKQDLKKWLGVQQTFVQSSYPRLKKQFIKLYVRFGNIVKSIKDEPYNIRNCLYLLQKVDFIPAYKKQAEDFQNHLKQLKQKYSLTLNTIIQMQLSIIGQKKKTLPSIQQDGQPAPVRYQVPAFTNVGVLQQKAPVPTFVSPVRSPISLKNQMNEKQQSNIQNQNKKIDNQSKNEGKKQIRIDLQKDTEKIKEKQIKSQKQKEIKSQRQKQKQKQKQLPKNKTQNLVNLTRQNGQKQLAINSQRKQQKVIAQTPINTQFLIQLPQSATQVISKNDIQKVPPQLNPIQAMLQKKAQLQRSLEAKQLTTRLESMQPVQRIKTVKQKRDEDARRAAQITQTPQEQTKISQSQINEKIKKQIPKKDQVIPRSQKAQWPLQSQKEDKNKEKQKISVQLTSPVPSMQPIVQFNRKNSFEDKRNSINIQMSKISSQAQESERPKTPPQKMQNSAVAVVQIQTPRQSPVQVTTVRAPYQKKDQDHKQREMNKKDKEKSQDKQREKDKERDRQREKQRERGRDNKEEWRKIDRQDRYSQERNQERDYKGRHYDKRQKGQQSRWKQRDQHRDRDKHMEDRNQKRKDSRDRSNKRKQDKYDKYDKSRKNDHKGKGLSRER